MKIQIDISEFWLDEDKDLEQGLRDYVSLDVKHQIWSSIKDLAKKQIEDQVRKQIEESLLFGIQEIVKETIATGKIGKEEISITQHIKNLFVNNVTSFMSPSKLIESHAKTFAEGMKKRYDVAYASAIVMELNKNGLLKDDAAKLLLKSND